MKMIFICFIITTFSFWLKANEETIDLSEFTEEINKNKIFVYPKLKPMAIPAYSIISLELKDDPTKLKPLSEVPSHAVEHFTQWTKTIIKKQYIDENMRGGIIALPDMVLFENKNPDHKPVFSWLSDILLVRNNTPKKSYSWDSGTFFVLCLTEEENSLENESQVGEHIKTVLARYTNFPTGNLTLYTFKAARKDGIWQGEYKHTRQNDYSWMKFVEFIIGRDFTCLFFAEMPEGEAPSLRAQPGDWNRF